MLSLAENALNIVKMARRVFPRIAFGLALVALSFLVCFTSIRTKFSGKVAGELQTEERVRKVWWQGTKVICIGTAL